MNDQDLFKAISRLTYKVPFSEVPDAVAKIRALFVDQAAKAQREVQMKTEARVHRGGADRMERSTPTVRSEASEKKE